MGNSRGSARWCMPTKELQTRKFDCAIWAKPKLGEEGLSLIKYERFEEALKDFAQACPCSYWAILHDLDTYEDGSDKPPHWHLVIETMTRHTKTGIISLISKVMDINSDRVSVDVCRHQPLALRYLMHLDDPDKELYPVFDVLTNDQATLNQAIACATSELTIDALKKALIKSTSTLDLIERIGLKNYQRYRATISDLLPIVKGSLKSEAVK